MSVFEIAILGIVVVLLAIQTKSIRSEYSVYISLAGSVVIFFYILSKLEVVIDTVNEIQSYIPVNKVYVTALVKMVGITYIAEFASAICKDAGYQSIAGQIEVFGKLSMLAVSMPILLALLETIQGFLG
jgi:stage III sporulation protein AD